MMTHMHAQRSKHILGGGSGKKNKRSNGIQAQLDAAAEESNTPARSTRSSKKLA